MQSLAWKCDYLHETIVGWLPSYHAVRAAGGGYRRKRSQSVLTIMLMQVAHICSTDAMTIYTVPNEGCNLTSCREYCYAQRFLS